MQRHRFVTAVRGHIEPQQEAAGGTAIAIPVAKDLVGEIELLDVARAAFLDMGLVGIGGDRDTLRARGIAATRQLAKRQLTWLRAQLDARWFDSGPQRDEIERAVDQFLPRAGL